MCHCAECGTEFKAKRADTAEFCGSKCRAKYNNRRQARGVQLLDMYIHTRFNRKEAQVRNMQTVIDRMIGNWVEEDRQAGRKVMRDIQEVMYGAVKHVAVCNNVGRAGK